MFFLSSPAELALHPRLHLICAGEGLSTGQKDTPKVHKRYAGVLFEACSAFGFSLTVSKRPYEAQGSFLCDGLGWDVRCSIH